MTKDSIEQCKNTVIKPKDRPLSHWSTLQPLFLRHELPTVGMRKSYVRDYRICERKLNRLQDVSSETEETSKACTGESEGLVATWGGDGGWGSGGRALGGAGADGALGGGNGGWDSWGGAVGVNGGSWDAGWGNWGCGGHWLGDSARAVGHGDGLAGSGSVGDAVEAEGGWGRADGGVGSVDLSGVHNSAVGPGRGRGGEREDDGGSGVLHLDGWY